VKISKTALSASIFVYSIFNERFMFSLSSIDWDYLLWHFNLILRKIEDFLLFCGDFHFQLLVSCERLKGEFGYDVLYMRDPPSHWSKKKGRKNQRKFKKSLESWNYSSQGYPGVKPKCGFKTSRSWFRTSLYMF